MMDILSEFKSQVVPILWMSDRNNWKIIQYKDTWLKGRPVFCCIDECGHSVVFAKDEEAGWIRLSGGGDFSGMNKVLKYYKFPKDSLNDPSALIKFLETFHKLYLMPGGEVLSEEFVTRYGDNFVGWLHLDRDVSHLKALCSNPVVKTEGNFLTIKFNVLSIMGSVECWTLYGNHIDDYISVEQLSISVLKPIGTYLYGIIG